MSTEELSNLSSNIPQWKRDLILRRRAGGRVLPTGSGSVHLTCPSVVDAVRLAEYSVNSDFHQRCESEREPTRAYRNMRLIEQVNTSDDFVEPRAILGIKEIITKIESGSSKELTMGEEKNGKKKFNSTLVCDKKANELNSGVDDDNASDSSEEFKYGPGIVSKLKSKYLSLTLRESQGKVRPSLDSLRRAASLENILNSSEPEKFEEYKSNYLKNIQPISNGSSNQRCRGLSRNNRESMKRARSVEVLVRYDRGNVLNGKQNLDNCLRGDESEGNNKRNIRNRISSLSVEEKELPPPDHVKQTLRIFEKSQTAKSSVNIKKKNQKKTDVTKDLVCAKKLLVAPRSLQPKQNGVDKINSQVLKNSTDGNKPNSNELSINQCNKSDIPNCEYSSVNIQHSLKGSDLSGNVSRKKAAFMKDTSCEPMVNNNSQNDNQLKSCSQDDIMYDKVTSSSLNFKNGLSLDLTDLATNQTNLQRASPTKPASSKCCGDRVITEVTEVKRSISPVLVRAPPSILSSELNSSNSPAQHMKQVGVIRPIVTNKVVQLNLAKQQLNKSHLTEREIEKNLINKVKCIEQPVTKVIVSLKKSPEECLVNESSQPRESVKKAQLWDQKSNTMIFNFSNRKTVPDYIENDGLILAPRREKPKLVEPGIIVLNGETEELSADFDPEELTFDPPAPCDIIFEGDNVLINGKSNIQTKPKVRKMKIQFNDEATTLFEYPSEASLLDDHENVKSETEDSSGGACSPAGLPIPFRGGSLASYTPSKVGLSTDFQLGITKTAPLPTSKLVKPENEKVERQDDEEEEGYLRPADDASTVMWSSETAADMLF